MEQKKKINYFYVAIGRLADGSNKTVVLPEKWIQKCPEDRLLPLVRDYVLSFYHPRSIDEDVPEIREQKKYFEDHAAVYKFQIASVHTNYKNAFSKSLKRNSLVPPRYCNDVSSKIRPPKVASRNKKPRPGPIHIPAYIKKSMEKEKLKIKGSEENNNISVHMSPSTDGNSHNTTSQIFADHDHSQRLLSEKSLDKEGDEEASYNEGDEEASYNEGDEEMTNTDEAIFKPNENVNLSDKDNPSQHIRIEILNAKDDEKEYEVEYLESSFSLELENDGDKEKSLSCNDVVSLQEHQTVLDKLRLKEEQLAEANSTIAQLAKKVLDYEKMLGASPKNSSKPSGELNENNVYAFSEYKGVTLKADELNYIDNFPKGPTQDSIFINYIMGVVFTYEELASCSVSGKKSRSENVRPQLDVHKKSFISDYFYWRLSNEKIENLEKATRFDLLNHFMRNKLETVRSKIKYQTKKENLASS